MGGSSARDRVRAGIVASGGTVALLTPRGWDRRGPRDRWPTLYLPAGGDGDHTTWTTLFQVQEPAPLRDILVVMPAMPLFGFRTDWWNGGKGGTYGHRELRVALPTLVDALRPAGPGPR
ncbi:hypothetical protein [Streptomyces sp. NK08203]|uniref:hypothetical protein n=1 Tax=Streptomyces sp. NK08203 TaxID=2821730 RepID=UPI001C2D44B6|nr:hypothetical protein [Streptomyces sp. NK08203]